MLLNVTQSNLCTRSSARPKGSTIPAPAAVSPLPARALLARSCSRDPQHNSRAQPRSRVAARVSQGNASSSAPPGTAETPVEAVRRELKALEHERDDAIQAAEHSAKTSVKLNEMLGLLEEMALEKVRQGDEEGAKRALQEKAATREAHEKAKAKAELNFALAAKLADKIGVKQGELLSLLRASAGPSTQPPPPQQQQGATFSPPSFSQGPSVPSSSSSYQVVGGINYDMYRGSTVGLDDVTPSGKPRWQVEIEERAKKAEDEAAQRFRAARVGAEDSIAAARERLKDRQARETLEQARERLRRNDNESIVEAQARLRQQDAEVLEYVRRVMARYRRGEAVSEDELEFAFQQLEKRFLL